MSATSTQTMPNVPPAGDGPGGPTGGAMMNVPDYSSQTVILMLVIIFVVFNWYQNK